MSQIPLHSLCFGCGICAAVCPTRAISMEITREGVYKPFLAPDRCSGCDLCKAVCPAISLDLKELSLRVFGRPPTDPYVGFVKSVYIGYSTDEGLRYMSSSGGVATALIIKALEDGMVDGALLVKMDERRPLLPKPFVARSPEEAKKAAGSKYCPVPLLTALPEAMELPGRFAVVGLPCHIWAMRKAEAVLKALREKAAFYIGLFCSHTFTFYATLLWLHELGVKPSEVVSLAYRGHGWPGYMTVKLRDGSWRWMPSLKYLIPFNPYLFTPLSCLACPDATNELADISVGDAWSLKEFTGELSPGYSLIVTRTPRGEELLKSAVEEGRLSVRELSLKELYKSQGVILKLKKKGFLARKRLLKARFGHLAIEVPHALKPDVRDYVSSSIAFLGAKLTSHRTIFLISAHVPIPLFRAFSLLFYAGAGRL